MRWRAYRTGSWAAHSHSRGSTSAWNGAGASSASWWTCWDEGGRSDSSRPASFSTTRPVAQYPRRLTSASVQRLAATTIVEAWISLARDLLVAKAGRLDGVPTAELLSDLPGAAMGLGAAPLVAFIGLLEAIHAGLAQNASPRLALEVAMLAWPTVS